MGRCSASCTGACAPPVLTPLCCDDICSCEDACMGNPKMKTRRTRGETGVRNTALMRCTLDVDGIIRLSRNSLTRFTLQPAIGAHFLLRVGGLALRFINIGQQEMNRWLVRAVLLSEQQIRQRIRMFT